jgi:tripartite ATP-independent transporter DctM subunit
MYRAMHRLAGGLRGGLAIGTVGVCTIFAAMSGVSGAATVTMGVIALPEMLKRGYDKGIAVGSIAGGGALGILIPPSITMIIFGLYSGVSVGKLFLGGVFAGLLLSSMFIFYIGIRCWLQPHLAVALPIKERASLLEKMISLRALILPAIIILMVLGSIFGGLATPAEAASIGALGSVISAMVYRRLTWDRFLTACFQTFKLTCMVMWVYFGALIFATIYTAVGATEFIGEMVMAMPGGRWGSMVAMQLSLIFLGMFIDQTGIIVITTPVFLPVVNAIGFDPVWFGVLFVINMEMGYLTPPFGLNLFYIKGVAPADVTMADIWRAGIPFISLQALCLAICAIFPQIILWLPGQMM